MGPFRDELGAARARIAELESAIEGLRPRAKPVDLPALIMTAAVAGIFGAMSYGVPAHAERRPIPSRTWGDHFPYTWDDAYVPQREQLDCFNGEYKCE